MSREIKTLESIIADVRSETKRSRSRQYGIDEYDNIKYLVQREQRRLWWDHNWKFLKVRRDIALVAGERYYDVPEDLCAERIITSKIQFGSEWIDLTQGIGAEEYSIYDSDADSRADPAEKWDIIDAGAGEQIEIWPKPASAQTARFTGIKNLGEFISDDHTCTLDATLITLFAAAALKPDDEKILAAANRLLTKMRGHEARISNGNFFSMGGSAEPARQPRRIIAVHDGA